MCSVPSGQWRARGSPKGLWSIAFNPAPKEVWPCSRLLGTASLFSWGPWANQDHNNLSRMGTYGSMVSVDLWRGSWPLSSNSDQACLHYGAPVKTWAPRLRWASLIGNIPGLLSHIGAGRASSARPDSTGEHVGSSAFGIFLDSAH